jgi:hypothetical protein
VVPIATWNYEIHLFHARPIALWRFAERMLFGRQSSSWLWWMAARLTAKRGQVNWLSLCQSILHPRWSFCCTIWDDYQHQPCLTISHQTNTGRCVIDELGRERLSLFIVRQKIWSKNNRRRGLTSSVSHKFSWTNVFWRCELKHTISLILLTRI